MNNDQATTYYNTVLTIQDADSIPINTNVNTINFNTIDTAAASGIESINGILYLGAENNPVPLSNIRLILKNANGDFINEVITSSLGTKYK